MTALRTWMVGKSDACAIVVDDEYASGVHCRIDQLEDGRFVVADMGSTNGTYIRDAVGTRRPVHSQQVIEFGETLIVGRSELTWPSEIFVRAEPNT